MTFRVGQKVVCVDAREAAHDKHIRLVKGRIYTISGHDPESDPVGVYLGEVPLGSVPFGFAYPSGWAPDRFRPIVERKTDISIFTRMLNPLQVDA